MQNSNESIRVRSTLPRTRFLIGNVVATMVLLAVSVGSDRAAPSLTEYQVKSLFLLNFAKYVDWPPDSSTRTTMPFTINVYGENKFGSALEEAVGGKTVSGRRIVLKRVGKDDDFGKCHILFISDSHRKELGEIFEKIRTLPVLTVGETDQFMEQGGMINFVKKAGKIRLEINLEAARQARLEISSKLLSVADVVKGKVN